MKRHLGNFGLMIGLLSLLVVPLVGFKFVTYDQSGNQVLGEETSRQRIQQQTQEDDEDEKDKENEEETESQYLTPSNVVKFFR